MKIICYAFVHLPCVCSLSEYISNLCVSPYCSSCYKISVSQISYTCSALPRLQFVQAGMSLRHPWERGPQPSHLNAEPQGQVRYFLEDPSGFKDVNEKGPGFSFLPLCCLQVLSSGHLWLLLQQAQARCWVSELMATEKNGKNRMNHSFALPDPVCAN